MVPSMISGLSGGAEVAFGDKPRDSALTVTKRIVRRQDADVYRDRMRTFALYIVFVVGVAAIVVRFTKFQYDKEWHGGVGLNDWVKEIDLFD